MSSQLDINSLFETTQTKQARRIEIYDKVLRQCHTRIKQYSKHELTVCFFAIPEFIIGVPLYDITELRTYLINSLEKNGFKIMYLHPNWLVIDWTEKKKSMERVKASKTVQSKPQAKAPSTYKSVNDYKPTGSFVYDQSSLNSLEEKTKQIFQVKTLNL